MWLIANITLLLFALQGLNFVHQFYTNIYCLTNSKIKHREHTSRVPLKVLSFFFENRRFQKNLTQSHRDTTHRSFVHTTPLTLTLTLTLLYYMSLTQNSMYERRNDRTNTFATPT